jgi:hypothetical protein
VRDTELYRHLLGVVAPWEVSQVELSVEDGRVDVRVEHPKRTRFLCPTAMLSWRSMTTSRNGHGDTWTRVRS